MNRTEIPSDVVFAGLKGLDADVLLIFDSCQAIPEPFTTSGKGIVSALASTGFEPDLISVAPVPGPHSFTRSLINELCDLSKPRVPGGEPKPFSDGSLYSNTIARLMCHKPEPLRNPDGSYMRDEDDNHIIEPFRRRTPIHRYLTQNRAPHPILLAPLPKANAPPYRTPESQRSPSRDSEPPPPRDEIVPCVLISLRMVPEALDRFDISAWANLILSTHRDVEDVRFDIKEISIENYYASCSGLMIIRMPLDVWGWMPKDPAMTFLGFINGGNQAAAINKQIEFEVRHQTRTPLDEAKTAEWSESRPTACLPSDVPSPEDTQMLGRSTDEQHGFEPLDSLQVLVAPNRNQNRKSLQLNVSPDGGILTKSAPREWKELVLQARDAHTHTGGPVFARLYDSVPHSLVSRRFAQRVGLTINRMPPTADGMIFLTPLGSVQNPIGFARLVFTSCKGDGKETELNIIVDDREELCENEEIGLGKPDIAFGERFVQDLKRKGLTPDGVFINYGATGFGAISISNPREPNNGKYISHQSLGERVPTASKSLQTPRSKINVSVPCGRLAYISASRTLLCPVWNSAA